MAKKTNALIECSGRKKCIVVCCYTTTLQETGFGELKIALYWVVKCQNVPFFFFFIAWLLCQMLVKKQMLIVLLNLKGQNNLLILGHLC